MWWGVLPPMGVIAGCMGVMFAGPGVIQYAATGRPSHRGVTEGTDYEVTQRLAYRRDTYNVGNEYEGRGFEYLDDE